MKQSEELEAATRDPVGHSAEAEIEQLMRELNSLHECDRALGRLICYGPKAIPALRRFLLEGKRSVVYQPRRAAVEALGALGAKDVLLQYLTWKREIEDPATRFAEQSVKNSAARELAKWRSKDVLDALLSFGVPHCHPGIVEALGQFGCSEAIPYLLHALEDDLCQAAAINGLRALGREAELALVTAARTKLPTSDEERPSSRRRRTKALEVLVEIGPSAQSWSWLRPLLEDSDPGIVTAVSRIAAFLGNREDKKTAAGRLLDVMPGADWYLRGEIQTCLVDMYPEARSRIEQEIIERNALPETERIMDPMLRTLLGVRRRAEQEHHPLRGTPT
jgi:HEAT repeat protein